MPPTNTPNPGPHKPNSDPLHEAISSLIEVLKSANSGAVVRPAIGSMAGQTAGTALANAPFFSKFFKEIKESTDALKNFKELILDYKKFSSSSPLGQSGLNSIAQSVISNRFVSERDKKTVLSSVQTASYYQSVAEKRASEARNAENFKNKVAQQYLDIRDRQKSFYLEKDKLNRQAARQQHQLGRVMGIYTRAMANVSLYRGPAINSPHYQTMIAARRQASRIQASINSKLGRARQAGQSARALNPQIQSFARRRAAAVANAARAHGAARGASQVARKSSSIASQTAAIAVARAGVSALGSAAASTVKYVFAFELAVNSAANATRLYAHEVNESNRKFSAFSPKTASAFTNLNIGEMRRFMQTAHGTSETASALANAVNRMNDRNQLLSISQLNIQNRLGLSAAGFAGGFGGPKGEMFHALDSLIGSLQNINLFGFKSHEDLMSSAGKNVSEFIFAPLIVAMDSLERTINWETREQQEDRRAKERAAVEAKAALGGPAEQFVRGMLLENSRRQNNVRQRKDRQKARGEIPGFGFGD